MLVAACGACGLTTAQVLEVLDTGSYLPPSLGRVPWNIFERCDAEKSADQSVSQRSRESRCRVAVN